MPAAPPLVPSSNAEGECSSTNNNVLVDTHSARRTRTKETTEGLFFSEIQKRAIESDCPALLLQSGPGTGKTHALAARIVYLLQTNKCKPEELVVLSFTNRDAAALKDRAIQQILFQSSSLSNNDSNNVALPAPPSPNQIWSGTIHAFSNNIIRNYNTENSRPRIIRSREAMERISQSLDMLLDPRRYQKYGSRGQTKLESRRQIYRDASSFSIGEEKRSISSKRVLLHQVSRCIELWKESRMVSPPMATLGISTATKQKMDQKHRDACLQLASRLGISMNVARLAWELFPILQHLHDKYSTCDPADLAPLAHALLQSEPAALDKLRLKLKHIVLDEYQDVSVAQHALIRLIVCGHEKEENDNDDEMDKTDSSSSQRVPPVLTPRKTTRQNNDISSSLFAVPRLFCAGDANQSIYGWRGAAPDLSVDGFRKDFSQGIVTRLDTSFRLPQNIWQTIAPLSCRRHHNYYFNKQNDVLVDDPSLALHDISPVGNVRAKTIVDTALRQCQQQDQQQRKRRPMVNKEQFQSLEEMLSREMKHSLSTDIRIRGVWDAREESKYIATTIKHRALDRIKQIRLGFQTLARRRKNVDLIDTTQVGVLVRTGHQIKVLEETFSLAGIPFVTCHAQDFEMASSSNKQNKNTTSLLPIKPIVLMTMHRAKGEEFDDIYLPGWTEGVFPHATAGASPNRIDEERRLAYVAISRARHRITITHSFVRQVLHGTSLQTKRVTMHVAPSRFIYEMLPEAQESYVPVVNNTVASTTYSKTNMPTIVWDRRRGSKEAMVGYSPPFEKAYTVPEGFKNLEQSNPEEGLVQLSRNIESILRKNTKLGWETKGHEKIQMKESLQRIKEGSIRIRNEQEELQVPEMQRKRQDKLKIQKGNEEQEEKEARVLEKVIFDDLVIDTLDMILSRKRGSAKQSRPVFVKFLLEKYGIKRGRVTLFSFEEDIKKWPKIKLCELLRLMEMPRGQPTITKPLSRATALQLGLYSAYLLYSEQGK